MSEFRVIIPFVRATYTAFDEDGPYLAPTWRPGVTYRFCSPDDTEAYANADGLMVLTLVSTHKPGRFPERSFYTRRFVNPNGADFGSGRLRIATTEKFRRLCSGWSVPYVLDPDELEHLTDAERTMFT